MLRSDTNLLSLLYQRLSLTPKDDIWYKVLQKRVADTRIRCIALAQTTDSTFIDPTKNPISGTPIVGRKIRVVLDQLRFSGWSGNLFRFRTQVQTNDNEYAADILFYPIAGTLGATGCNNTLGNISLTLFEGYVSTHLYVEVRANKTISPLPLYPTVPACACDGQCFPGQTCGNVSLPNQCTASTTQQLPIYGKTLTGDVAAFVKAYSSSNEYPDNIKDWSVMWHIEYL